MNATTIDTTAPYIAFGEPMPAPDFTRMKRASTALGELTALLKPLVGPLELASGTDLGRGGLTLFRRAGWVSAVEYRRGTPRNAILHLDFDHEGRNAVVRMAGTGSIGDRTRWEASHISEAIRMCRAEVEYSCEVSARADLVDRVGDLGKVSVTPGRKARGVFVATLAALVLVLMGAFRGPASAQPASCKSMPAGAHWIACGPNDPGPDAALAALRAEEARQAVAPAALRADEARQSGAAAPLQTAAQLVIIDSQGGSNAFPVGMYKEAAVYALGQIGLTVDWRASTEVTVILAQDGAEYLFPAGMKQSDDDAVLRRDGHGGVKVGTQARQDMHGHLNTFPADATEADMDAALATVHSGLLVRTADLGPCDVQVVVGEGQLIGFHEGTGRGLAVATMVKFGLAPLSIAAAEAEYAAALADEQKACHASPVSAALEAFNGSVRSWFK